MSKIQQVSASSIRSKLVDDPKKLELINEPGQNVEDFGNKVIELTRHIAGSGFAPDDLTSIVAGCFTSCDELGFQLTSWKHQELVDKNPSAMKWEDIVSGSKERCHSLCSAELWSPKLPEPKTAEASTLDGLSA
jgi:hypothetical protein